MNLRTVLACWSLTLLGVFAGIGEVRTWTSAEGRPLKGKLLEVSAEEIVVQKNGRPIKVAVNLLSDADQELVKELVAESLSKGLQEGRGEGFREGKYAEFVQGEWILGGDEFGLPHQIYIGKEVKKKKAGPVVPLFVHLHGASSRAEQATLGKVEIAPKTIIASDWYEDHPCVVMVPTCPPDPLSWNKAEVQEKSMGGQGIDKAMQRRPEFYAGAVFADGMTSQKWVGTIKTPMWSYFSNERNITGVEELQEGFASDGVEFRYNVIEDSDHNSIHWTVAKAPEVWEWLFAQGLE